MSPQRQFAHGLVVGANVLMAALYLAFGADSHGPSAETEVGEPLSPSAKPEPTLWRQFDSSDALGDIAYLCWEVGPRPAGSAAERRAAAYLAHQLADLGYVVSLQQDIKLNEAGLSTANVIGLAPRAGGKPRFVLGAHYDTVSSEVQGANDNASGVAVVLEVARRLVRQPLPYAVQVVFFGAEERSPTGASLMGSRHFATRCSGSVAAMLNVDMVGCGTDLHVWQCGARGRYLASLVTRSAAALGLSVDAAGRSCGSDHSSFARVGIPSVWLQSLPDPGNHTSADQPHRISALALQRAGRLLLHTLTSVEPEDVRLLQKRCGRDPKAGRPSGR